MVGYVEARGGQSVSGESVREEVRGRLPDYMVPSVVVVMEKLPLTANGKVDRQNLPEVEEREGREEEREREH